MNEKDKIRKELEGLSPLLLKMKEQGGRPFRVPEGYFEYLPGEVLRRARAEEGLIKDHPPATADSTGLLAWLQGWFTPRRAMALATVSLLVAAGIFLFWPQPLQPGPEEALAGISGEEAKAYVSDNIGEFGLDLLLEAAVVSADEVPEMEVLPDIGQEDIDQYLDELIEEMSLDELEELL